MQEIRFQSANGWPACLLIEITGRAGAEDLYLRSGAINQPDDIFRYSN
ncbi:hypothetical protein [Spirosoma foliorum]|uniref:Uncharacterized protein n=1 Tax=Spirosoma foliorum TaxID=2710596 RepID=A0A7G5GS48_9BACT|nr:hypothetical protein [Spirosoma foliorum]QMW01690.1 hypothetical protein H3H32_27620 [Spirosoma foliorum]